MIEDGVECSRDGRAAETWLRGVRLQPDACAARGDRLDLRLFLRRVRDRRVALALAACDGNIAKAANLLGVRRQTLQRWVSASARPDSGDAR